MDTLGSCDGRGNDGRLGRSCMGEDFAPTSQGSVHGRGEGKSGRAFLVDVKLCCPLFLIDVDILLQRMEKGAELGRQFCVRLQCLVAVPVSGPAPWKGTQRKR